MDIQLSNYVRGKQLKYLLLVLLRNYLFIIGLKVFSAIICIVGLSVIIPYVGAFLVTIPIVVIGLQFGLGTQFTILISLYLLLQALDGNLLVPIIFSENS